MNLRCIRSSLIGLAALAYVSAQTISFDLLPDRTVYAPGDTAIIVIDIDIPRGYYLCGNPVGPGVGMPLTIKPDASDKLTWLELRASEPKKIGSGDEWVWGYRFRATLYLSALISKSVSGRVKGGLRIEGLACKAACERVSATGLFTITVRADAATKPFGGSFLHRQRYDRAHRMPVQFGAVQQASDAVTANGDNSGQTLWDVRSDSDLKPKTEKAVGPETQNMFPTVLTRGQQTVPPVARHDWDDVADPQWDYTPTETRVRYNLLLAILFGLIGGLLLNVMPCVLPVLGIKILSFSEGRGTDKRTTVIRSLSFAAGVVVVFLVLASFAAFANFSWGEQFRNPVALSVVVCVIVVFALGLFDVYALVVPPIAGAAVRAGTHGLRGDFLRGMVATVMATPCSGPLLGATLAWTLSQQVVVIYAVFLAIGVGMAAPYVVLASSSRLMKLVPRPGPWMDDFKHAMGYLLLAWALYLLVGLRAEMIVATLSLCLFAAAAMMFHQRFAPLEAPRLKRMVVFALALSFIGVGARFSYGTVLTLLTAGNSVHDDKPVWRVFSAAALNEAHARGEHVIVDFTAAWCMNCQYNKKLVLDNDDIVELLREKQVTLLKADLTGENRPAESLLEHLGSRSIPFLAIFPGDDPYQPIVMRDVLRRANLRDALKALPER